MGNQKKNKFLNFLQSRKKLFGVLLLASLTLPLSVLALDESESIAQKPKSLSAKAKTLVLTALGLRIYWDPTATTYQKVIAAGKFGCCSSAVITGAAANIFPVGTPYHLALSICCAGSWTAYSGMLLDSGKKEEL